MLKDFGIDACVFDFDGTIVLTEHIHMKAWEDLALEVNLSLPENFLAESVGHSDHELVQIVSRFWNNKISTNEIYSRKKGFYQKRAEKECELVPGAIEALASASRRCPIALATNSSLQEIEPIISYHRLDRFFSAVVTIDLVSKPKPSPEIYLLACQKIGVAPSQALAFEDSIAGCQSARAAGLKLIALTTIFPAQRLEPHLFAIRDFTDPKVKSMLNPHPSA